MHLCLTCCYSREVWHMVINWIGQRLVAQPSHMISVEGWWISTLAPFRRKERRSMVAIIMYYTAWNIWKERNRRVFGGKSMTTIGVFALIRGDIALRRRACGTPSVG
uniref:Reverse transcriptase zinc-binding domain-containing protein n=1 Tax=Setaria italica TaxID=4555 RepID=K4AMD6_SETIT